MYRYINPGYATLFPNYIDEALKQLTDSTQSKTGVSFWGDGYGELQNIPVSTKELWIKVDYYTLTTSQTPKIYIRTENTYCAVDNNKIYVNGTNKTTHSASIKERIDTIWLHLKSDATNGVFEVWVRGTKQYEFIGDVLHGEDIKKIHLSSGTLYENRRCSISNIIVSDSPISLTEQVVTIPCTITADMTKNEDGSYSATAVNQSLEYAIDASEFDAGTKFTGVNIAARNCIRDGEGVNNLEFLEGATSLDTQTIPTAENCGLSYGITLNDESPATFALHNYKLKAK